MSNTCVVAPRHISHWQPMPSPSVMLTRCQCWSKTLAGKLCISALPCTVHRKSWLTDVGWALSCPPLHWQPTKACCGKGMAELSLGQHAVHLGALCISTVLHHPQQILIGCQVKGKAANYGLLWAMHSHAEMQGALMRKKEGLLPTTTSPTSNKKI